MDIKRFRRIFDDLDDPEELVFEAEIAYLQDLLLASWEAAAGEAQAAYELWRSRRDGESYAVYRACADRADAAQDALALRARRVA